MDKRPVFDLQSRFNACHKSQSYGRQRPNGGLNCDSQLWPERNESAAVGRNCFESLEREPTMARHAQFESELFKDHGKLRTAATMGELKRQIGPLPQGYTWFVRQFFDAGDIHVDLYFCPHTSKATAAPEMVPEGSHFVGTVKYMTREHLLADLS